jgi:hypothetical protein
MNNLGSKKEALEKCLKEKDLIPETCSFVKKCEDGKIRNPKGRCVKINNIKDQLNSLQDRITKMKQRSPKSRGLIKAQLMKLFKKNNIENVNKNRIKDLLEMANKPTNIEKNKGTQKVKYMIEKRRRKQSKADDVKRIQTMKNKMKQGKRLGTSLNGAIMGETYNINNNNKTGLNMKNSQNMSQNSSRSNSRSITHSIN